MITKFDSPYLERDWTAITDFQYETDLHLTRTIQSVRTRADTDADYVLAREYRVSMLVDDIRHRIVIPPGLITDLASVPRFAQSFVGKVGPHLEASIVHDFGYIAWQSMPYKQADNEDRFFIDNVFLAAMKSAGVSFVTRNTIYQAVRMFGSSTYKTRDERRFVYTT